MNETQHHGVKDRSKFNKVFGSFVSAMQNGGGKKVEQYTRLTTKIGILVVAAIIASAGYNFLSSDLQTDFALYEKGEGGKVEFLKIKASKRQPKIEVKNLLSVEINGEGGRGVDYRRRVISVFGMQLYLGGGATVMPNGHFTYHIGGTLGF